MTSSSYQTLAIIVSLPSSKYLGFNNTCTSSSLFHSVSRSDKPFFKWSQMVALKESRQALNKKPKKKPDHEQVEEETPKPENTDEDSDLADKVKGLKLKKKTNQKKKKKKTLDQQSEEEEEHTEPETNQESSKASKLKKKKKVTTKMSKKKALEEPEEEEEEEGIPEAELSFYSNADEEQDRENGSESDGPGGAAEESDSSEDEVAPRNTIGDVPLKWYEDEDHIGYNISGKKIKKQAKRDMLESFLADADNNKNWRKIHDDYNDEEIELTKEEIKLIRRVLKGKTPNAKTDPYQDYVDFFKWDDAKHPLSNAPEPKRRFIPSKSENKMVIKLVRAIRNGNIKINQPIEEPHLKLLWGDDSSSFENAGRGWSYIPAPKPKLAGHEESYNPSVEFIPTPEERNSYELMYEEDRPRFIPTSFGSLRSVPAYKNALKETMDRCLDLYLCPRTLKKRINIDPESLKPKLPSRKDLKPYPSTCYLEYKGHKGAIVSISIDMSGKWLASGSTDGTVRVWEVQNGRCLKIWEVSEAVHHVSWNPVLPILAVSVGHDVLLLDTGYGNEEQQEKIKELVHVEAPSDSENSASIVNWLQHDKYDGIRLKHIKNVSTVEWHRRGDYFSTVMPGGDSRAILIHQLSKRSTKNISFKLHGLPVSSKFHPTRSFFFISTKKTIRVYDLVKEKLIRKLEPGVREVSSISIHPAGDNVIVGSREGKLCWFDMDLSSKPYQRLKCHPKDITNVAFHRSYPLFASCSEDGTAYVFHGMVYADINQNPLIVPLEILRGHTSTNGRGVLDCVFHPRNPWLFTAGADSVIKLYVD